MKNNTVEKQETFEYQLKRFKALLFGTKMAKISSILLIAFSLMLMFFSDGNMFVILSLLAGAIALIVYIVKFLSVKGIEQKSYTPKSMTSSIPKLKTYLNNRKKYEMYSMIFWIISLIPFASFYLGSNIEVILGAIIFTVIVSFFGQAAFKKVDKDLQTIETVMLKELKTQNS